MQLRFLARKTHKWLTLIVGIQVMLWIVSGLYMTVIDIDLIHGDHLVKPLPKQSLSAQADEQAIAPLPTKVFKRYGHVSAIKLIRRIDKTIYLLSTDDGTIMLDATNGAILGELTQQEVMALATTHYAGDAAMVQTQRLDQYPAELGGRNMPVWQVRFDDWLNSTLYFDVNSGQLIRKRSDLWRWFDFFWMLHIMDYETRDDINNNLLRLAAGLGLIMSFSGLMLLWYRFKPRSEKA